MRRYASSKIRIGLLALLLGAVIFVTTGYAQDVGADQGTTQVRNYNVVTLIFSHMADPIFWSIALLSVTAVTLIIQGFIQNRAAVMLPEASHNQIRELIAQKQFKELIEFTEQDPSFVSRALNPALKRAPSFSSMKEAMETASGSRRPSSSAKSNTSTLSATWAPCWGSWERCTG